MTEISSRFLTVVVLVFSVTILRADPIPEIATKAKPAVIEILAADTGGAPKSQGTGFFVSPDGLLVTNRHVIEGATSITAVSNTGAIFLFERVVGEPPGVDIAVLKFHATDVPFLKLGESTTAVEGQKVIVIGNPKGLMGTVSDGIISAFRENRSLIQITAPISPGSSGSPVMDEAGRVIGVATLVSTEGRNLNFAIAVENVAMALSQSSGSFAIQKLPTPTPTRVFDANTFIESGNTASERKDFNMAIFDFGEAIQLDPKSEVAYYGRGNAYYNQGKLYNAISDYNDAIRLNPNDALAHNNRGNAYFNQGRLDEAINDYNDAIRLNPYNAAAYNNRGNALAVQGMLHEAINDYNEAILLDPNYATAYRDRGLTFLRIGDRDKAYADFAVMRRLQAAQ